MKLHIIMINILLALSFNIIYPQNSQINWWAIDAGFTGSSNNTTLIKSAVGQAFASINTNDATRIESGFLANRKLHNIVVLSIDDELYNIVSINLYPNPIENEAVFRLQLDNSSSVKLTIYDIFGNEIAVLYDDYLSSGLHYIKWNGSNKYSVPIPSGTYFYTLKLVKNNKIRIVSGTIAFLR